MFSYTSSVYIDHRIFHRRVERGLPDTLFSTPHTYKKWLERMETNRGVVIACMQDHFEGNKFFFRSFLSMFVKITWF